MSPRAAWRLESLGYTAYDYVAGKADWLAYGLPYEGSAVLAGSTLTTDIETCGFRDRLGDVRGALAATRFGMLIVLNTDSVVMGLLDQTALDKDDGARVDQLMREGPTTVRPSEELEPLVQRMQGAEVDAITVTTSGGLFLGVLERGRAEHALQEE